MNTEQLPNILQWPTIVILKLGRKKIMTEQLGEVSSASLLEEPLRRRVEIKESLERLNRGKSKQAWRTLP